MITSHTNVGRTYEEAGRMKTDHEKFQSTAKVWRWLVFLSSRHTYKFPSESKITVLEDILVLTYWHSLCWLMYKKNTQPKTDNLSVDILEQTCYKKPILRCVRMACDSLLTTSSLQIVNRLVAGWLSKFVIHRQACCKLFQQIVTSLQMTSCNKPYFNRLVAAWWN